VTKFLCIDDDSGASTLVRRLRDEGLDVDLSTPKPMEEQFETLSKDEYDGLILDLRLDERQNDGFKADYLSNLPARFVRDRTISSGGRDVPIVIWSGNKNLREFYRPDFASHDLYDAKYDKGSVPEYAQSIVQELRSLDAAYRRVAGLRGDGRRGFQEMLGLDSDDALDLRIGSRFDGIKAPSHEFIRYVKQEIIEQPYPLVSDRLIAARFGIELNEAARGVFGALDPARYSGILSEAWPRWWWEKVVGWMEGISKGTSFQQLPAAERVGLLNKAGFDVTAADPIEKNYLTRYWTICDVLQRPLDPANGFVSSASSSEPWHDRRYISLKAALESGADGITVNASERRRFESIRARG
jgi:hypothetical protein